ncbi:hypothetical protein [Actinomadura keratinilytica]|uniref:hypothetical protein n=1 Tax=Actinomadura keratinilytica TaxID=547461 RepID=UPI0036089432
MPSATAKATVGVAPAGSLSSITAGVSRNSLSTSTASDEASTPSMASRGDANGPPCAEASPGPVSSGHGYTTTPNPCRAATSAAPV